MRFLHTSDWHLGRTLHRQDLTDAHQAYLDHLVELARAEEVDAVLVSGDVYDRPIPPLDAVRQLDEALARLSEVCHVVLTSGNHDSATRLGFGAGLMRERVHVRTSAGAVGTPVVVPDADGDEGMRVFCLPYLDPDLVRGRLGPLGQADVPAARSHAAVVGGAMERVRGALEGAPRVPGVVMAHAFVTGGEASESEREIRVGGVASVPAGLLEAEGVDYVALGHLHGPQRIQAGVPVRYSGSPLAFSFSEKDHVKGTVLVEMGPAGVVSEERVAAPVPRRLVEVRGSLAELVAAAPSDRDAWVKVTVTDEVRPEHLFARVKDVFPHALVVLHEPPVSAPVTGVTTASVHRDPAQVLGEFVEQVTGAPPGEAEAAVLREAWEQALAEGATA